MKTKLHIAALITIITVIITGNLLAQELTFEEESYINDIPFNTASIAADYSHNKALTVLFEMEEEAYIDDIPYNTYEVAKNCNIEKYLKNVFVFEEEEYIDDIPFNTEKIFNEAFFTYYYEK